MSTTIKDLVPDFSAGGVLKYLTDRPGVRMTNYELSRRFKVSVASVKIVTAKLHAHARIEITKHHRSTAYYIPSEAEIAAKNIPPPRYMREPLSGYDAKLRQFSDICMTTRGN